MAQFQGYVVLDPVKVNELLRGANGPVVRELYVAGELVRQEAKRLVGVSTRTNTQRRGAGGKFVAQRKPGTLRDSIVKRLVQGSQGPVMQVGSDDPVALWHHEGTQPHVIRPKQARMLVFYWPKVGKVVYLPIVHHPGTRPNRFLINALRVLRSRY